MVHPRQTRENDKSFGILDKAGNFLRFNGFIIFYIRICMIDSGGRAEKHRRFVFLGILERILNHLICFLDAAWIEYRNSAVFGKQSGILLRLRGDRSGIVGRNHNQAAFYADIRK